MHGMTMFDDSDLSPGRFFAVTLMKSMLALLLLQYDIKTKDGMRPADTRFQKFLIPNLNAEILFRRRRFLT